jgi:hypothetical protein
MSSGNSINIYRNEKCLVVEKNQVLIPYSTHFYVSLTLFEIITQWWELFRLQYASTLRDVICLLRCYVTKGRDDVSHRPGSLSHIALTTHATLPCGTDSNPGAFFPKCLSIQYLRNIKRNRQEPSDISKLHKFESQSVPSETSVHSVSSKQQIERSNNTYILLHNNGTDIVTFERNGNLTFYDVTPCSPATFADVSKEHTASIFSTQQARGKQCFLLVSRHHAAATYGGVEV